MVFSGLSPETIAAASRPNLVSGEETLADVLRRLSSFAVITMPEPWELVDPDVQRLAATVHFVEGMEHEQAERLVAAVPAVDYVVGLGGGTAVDAAKYVAWRRGLGLITAPSVISVDAAVTNTIAVREGRRCAMWASSSRTGSSLITPLSAGRPPA